MLTISYQYIVLQNEWCHLKLTCWNVDKYHINRLFYNRGWPWMSSGGARPQNLGEGGIWWAHSYFFWGGGKIEFLKRYCYLPMPLSHNFCPPPRRFAPSQKGAIFLGIPPPGDVYSTPPKGANAPGISPPPLGYSPPIYAMRFNQIISWYFHRISALRPIQTGCYGNATRIFSFQWQLTFIFFIVFQIFGTT